MAGKHVMTEAELLDREQAIEDAIRRLADNGITDAPSRLIDVDAEIEDIMDMIAVLGNDYAEHRMAGSGVCEPCRYKATAEPHGYALRHSRRGDVFKGRIYLNWTDARKAFEGIVWHNREWWEICPVMIGAPSDRRNEATEGQPALRIFGDHEDRFEEAVVWIVRHRDDAGTQK